MTSDEISTVTSNHGSIEKSPSSNKKKKGTRAMHVIKVAIHMLRRKRSEKKQTGMTNPSPLPLPLSSATNDALTRLVGSVRPLHLQGGIGGGMVSPPPPPPLLLPPPSPERGTEQVVSPGLQSESSFFSAFHSSGDGTISRYGSVQSLYDLGIADEDENVNINNDEADAYYDGLEVDELIDSKAEMFIAQFYKSINEA